MKNHKITLMGLLLAVSLILSYVESLIPFFFGMPGMKLGLANLAIVMTLYVYGAREAIVINSCRIILAGFLFGNLSMILYSFSGALFSFLVMLLVKYRKGITVKGVSMAGGVAHNIGQITVAFLVVKTGGVFYYIPALIIVGMITGFFIGELAQLLIPHINKLLTAL